MLGKKETVYENWLEGFYKSSDYDRRCFYLSRGKEMEDPEIIKWYQEILDARYTKKKDTVIDHFMGAWLEMKFLERTFKQFMGKKRAPKEAQRTLKELMLTQDLPSWKSDILRKEYEHLIRSYILICQDDRTYNSKILNFGSMKPEALEKKLIDDIKAKAISIPALLSMEKEFSLLTKAAKAVLYED